MNQKSKKFFLLVFITTWLLWLPTVIHSQWREVPSFFLLIGMFAGFMPSLIGLYFLKKDLGPVFSAHIKDKLKLSFPKKYLALLLIFPLHGAVSLAILHLLQDSFLVENPIPLPMVPLVFLQILFIGGALGEEFGWRGYAYEKLSKRHGLFMGTLVLGILWSLWHLPLFFMEGTVQSHLPLWQFMVQNTLLAFFYTWLYLKSKGNLTMMILLHGVLNTSAAVFPYWQANLGRYIGLGLLILLLLIIFLVDRPTFSQEREKRA